MPDESRLRLIQSIASNDATNEESKEIRKSPGRKKRFNPFSGLSSWKRWFNPCCLCAPGVPSSSLALPNAEVLLARRENADKDFIATRLQAVIMDRPEFIPARDALVAASIQWAREKLVELSNIKVAQLQQRRLNLAKQTVDDAMTKRCRQLNVEALGELRTQLAEGLAPNNKQCVEA